MIDPRDCVAAGSHFALIGNGRCYYCNAEVPRVQRSREPETVADDILGYAEWDYFCDRPNRESEMP